MKLLGNQELAVFDVIQRYTSGNRVNLEVSEVATGRKRDIEGRYIDI